MSGWPNKSSAYRRINRVGLIATGYQALAKTTGLGWYGCFYYTALSDTITWGFLFPKETNDE